MQTYIKKWGNSYGIRIPLQIMRQLSLHPGSVVDLKVESDRLVIDVPKYNLEEMLSSITSENIQELSWEDDNPKGIEI